MSRTARRANRRQTLRTLRERRRATAAVTGGTPQTARTHMLAVGLSAADAKRFAGAFSRGVTPTAETETEVKARGGKRLRVAVKLYDRATFLARLAHYRPGDKTAAARFHTAAAFTLAA